MSASLVNFLPVVWWVDIWSEEPVPADIHRFLDQRREGVTQGRKDESGVMC